MRPSSTGKGRWYTYSPAKPANVDPDQCRPGICYKRMSTGVLVWDVGGSALWG